MTITELLSNKEVKPKEKTDELSRWILDERLSTEDLIAFATNRKEPVKATCMEALEFATKLRPEIATLHLLLFATQALTDKAPRVKWEAAKVIGNIAHQFPTLPEDTINNLLANTEFTGTVVRWSAAYALTEILKQNTAINTALQPAAEAICAREEKNSIKKIYQSAFKKLAPTAIAPAGPTVKMK